MSEEDGMKKVQKKFLWILLLTEILIGLVVGILIFGMTRYISIYIENALEVGSINMIADRMRERVNNTIISIESKRKDVLKKTNDTASILEGILKETEEDNLETRIGVLTSTISISEYGNAIEIYLYEKQTQQCVQFTSNGRQDATETFHAQEWEKDDALYPIFMDVSYGNYDVYIVAKQQNMDEIVKSYIYEVIHDSVYGENGYVWVNEIVDYEGGENYAIRRIHPNLKDTEGQYLSTNKEDIKGNKPYLSELVGIKESGEVFHTYYFKNKGNDEIAEKYSYAKFYEPFDWIIATGEPLESALTYANELNEYTGYIMKDTLYMIFGSLIIIFVIGMGIMVISNRKYQKNVDKYIIIETKTDALTGAYNRKMAQSIIPGMVEKPENRNEKMYLMVFDIDNFKRVNDTYGHDIGDIVLKNVAKTIMKNIGKDDFFFRWGGEEFVLLFQEKEFTHHQIAERLLKCVQELSFDSKEGTFSVTVSIGGSAFGKEDTDYLEVFKRADTALYHSKHTGKNKYTNAEELEI